LPLRESIEPVIARAPDLAHSAGADPPIDVADSAGRTAAHSRHLNGKAQSTFEICRETTDCRFSRAAAPYGMDARSPEEQPVKAPTIIAAAGLVMLSAVVMQALTADEGPQAARGFKAFIDGRLDGLNGNGRACADCHMPTDHFQLSPDSVEQRYRILALRRANDPTADDPLFRPIDADDFHVNGDQASDFSTLRQHALVRITMPLPSNISVIDPATRAASTDRFVDVRRMVPTIENVALTGPDFQNPWFRGPNLTGGYQLDARVETLQDQALGAFVNHAQVESVPSMQTLDDLASFERGQFTSPRVRALADAVAQGAADLPDPDLPLTPLQEQGKVVFIRACTQCHGGPGLSTPQSPVVRYHDIATQCPRPVDTVTPARFNFTPCDPSLSKNARTYEITLPDGTKIRRTTDDPGRALLTGFVGGPANSDDWNKFDMPGLRGLSKTAPYFHNNSAATLEDVVDHYIEFFKRVKANAPPGVVPPIASTDGVHFDRAPTPAEVAALIAYLNVL
jgi:cytochrome c peroxidase